MSAGLPQGGDRVRVTIEGTFQYDSGFLSNSVVTDVGDTVLLGDFPKTSPGVQVEVIEEPNPEPGTFFQDSEGVVWFVFTDGPGPLYGTGDDFLFSRAADWDWDYVNTLRPFTVLNRPADPKDTADQSPTEAVNRAFQ